MLMRCLTPILVLVLSAQAASGAIKIEIRADGRKVFSNTGGSGAGRAPSLGRAIAPQKLEPLVATFAARRGLDPKLVHAVIRAESGYNPRAVSSKGAIGLMQLMPATARELDVEDPFDPAQNIAAGTRYLKRMLDRFQGSLELALAGYNAGPEAVRRFGGVPPFAETRAYVERVLRDYRDDRTYTLTGRGVVRVGRQVHLRRDPAGRVVLTTASGN